VLLALGITAFVYQNIPESVGINGLNPEPRQMTVEKADTLPLMPIAGMILLAGGMAVLVLEWTDRSV
jgi:hypothetical protein